MIGASNGPGSTHSFEELILATATGDRSAFDSLYTLSSAQLFGIILRIIRQRDRAEDVLQEVYVRIWTHASDYRPEKGAALAWMATIARNRALDWRRRERADISLDAAPGCAGSAEPNPVALDWSRAGADARALKTCLDELPQEQRACILLAHVEGYTHEELARRLDRPVGTVKSWIRRGLFRLRTCLER